MPQTWTQTQRFLALSLRTRRFGYAMFEGTKLLDYGICSCEAAVSSAKRIDGLVRLLHPARILASQQCRIYDRSRPDSQLLFQSIKRAAKHHEIDFEYMPHSEIRTAFVPSHADTKYEMATVAANIFPELLTKLPAPRKTWEPEREIMLLFDTVAVGIAYIEKRRGQLLPFL